MKKSVVISAVILFFVAIIAAVIWHLPKQGTQEFDAQRAYQDVLTQVEFGARVPGSLAHAETIQYIAAELRKSGWKVELQNTSMMDHEITNIIAKRGKGSQVILLGAHYDSRLLADQDSEPELANQPVSGANDGASGVAVLLELARVLPENIDKEVWLVFFDAEDQGRLPGWDWILGSRAYVNSLDEKPDAAVIIDMIGDLDLNVYREINSDKTLTNQIWEVAKQLGYSNWIIDEEKYRILDDHIPFLEVGIPAVDLIDFDYPYWHTSQDTADKVSPESLKVIGDTLLHWLSEPME